MQIPCLKKGCKIHDKCSPREPNGGRNREKVYKKQGPEIDVKKGAYARIRPEGRPVGRAAPSDVLNISRRDVFVF